MRAIYHVALLTAVCGLGLWSASDVQARGGFLRGLFDRGGSCCQSACYTQSCCGQSNWGCGQSNCYGCNQGCGGCNQGCSGCGGSTFQGGYISSGCGCGTAAPSGGVIIDGSYGEPTEASPADVHPPVPEPPKPEVTTDAAT
ncbi:MAG: hypothetical protein ACR2NU_17435 [Aeoliella sp.]